MVSGNVMLSVAVILTPHCSSGPDHDDHNTGSYHEPAPAPGEHRVVRDRDGGGPATVCRESRALQNGQGFSEQFT